MTRNGAINADVLIVGAGPAGATAALNLAPSRRVVVLHRPVAPLPRIGESVPGAVGPLFAAMGLLPAFLAQGHAPCYANRAVWGGPTPVETDFLRDPNGHGWHLDRAGFDAWLVREGAARGAMFREITRIEEVGRDNGVWRVRAGTRDGPLCLGALALIDAGGRAAPLARRFGARRMASDRLVCAWTRGFARPGGTGAGVTFLEAVAGGWWYTAPLPGDQRVLAFHSDSDLLDLRAGEDGASLPGRLGACRDLAAVLESCAFEPRAPVSITPANGGALEPCVGPGWLAAGDAAISFDPLSAQGIFNALYTGLAAAEAADRLLAGQQDSVAAYQRRIGDILAAYRLGLAHWYGLERRFADAPFWRRRHGDRGI